MAKKSVAGGTRRVRSLDPQPRSPVSREEFNRVVDLLRLRGEAISALQHELDLTVTRISQQQVEIDRLKRQIADLSR